MRAALLPTVALAVLVAASPVSGRGGAADEIRIGRDDLQVTRSVRVAPGEYRVRDGGRPGVVIIQGNDITVDFRGAVLVGHAGPAEPDRFEGCGICIRRGKNVTLRHAVVRGFKVGIAAYDVQGLTLENCDTSGNFRQRLRSTPEREDGADWLWPHHNDRSEWTENYGAGVSLVRCTGATVKRCTGRQGQNGLLLAFCRGCRVYDNDYSFNSGWGLGMWRSSENVVSRNRFDWCVRGYSHGVYARGQDSAGILVFEQCSDNVFALNSATHGGDGFFLYAGHETTQRTGQGGCNRNLLWRNDFSHAVANGIEATFSEKNRFVENVLNDCNYGVWAGYSTGTVIVGNRIEDNDTAGIAIEHGSDTSIEGNRFRRNGRGIQLWWDPDREFLESVYGRKRNTESEDYSIVLNRFAGDRTGIELRDTRRVRIESNEFAAVPRVLHLLGKADPEVTLAGNNIRRDGGTLEHLVLNETEHVQSVGRNFVDVSAAEPAAQAEERPGGPVKLEPPLEKALGLDFAALSHRERPPEAPGEQDAFLPEGTPRGRARIVVDEWGPFDYRTLKLLPRAATGWNDATFHLLGPAVPFAVEAVTGGVQVEPAEGTAPARLTVRPEPGGPDLRRFSFRVTSPGREPLEATGAIVRVRWHVAFHTWKRGAGEDPKDPPGGGTSAAAARAWKRILASPPVLEQTLPRLAFPWGGQGPTAAVRDYFATVATAEIRLPAGRYRIRTVSDDGIRVRVDGAPVIEDWTWHPPRSNETVVRLEAGTHRIRVEHFEIDGYAQLELGLVPEEGDR